MEQQCPCGNTDLMLAKKIGSTQTGLYCRTCGRWLKWVGKTELRKYLLSGMKVKELD